uniref:DUF5641 domain-containing protein n=1 Tax=Haemonchus contortus TaxID=6289 RepID=A0A7I4YHE4_HAECO
MTLHQQRLNRLHNEDIRSLSKVRDIILHIDKTKHSFAGHLIRRDDRWTMIVGEQQVCAGKHARRNGLVVDLLYDGNTLLLTETISAILIQLRYQSTGQHWLKIENRGKGVGTRARAIAADNGSPSNPSKLKIYMYIYLYIYLYVCI